MSIDPSTITLTSWYKANNFPTQVMPNTGEIWGHGNRYVLIIDKASYYRFDYWKVYVLEDQVKDINFVCMFVSQKYGWSRIA